MRKKIVLDELQLPTTSQLEEELQRENYKARYGRLLKNTLYVLFVVVALSVIVATLVFPVLQIYGDSMEPTLSKDEIVVGVNKSNFKTGDVIAFYYNNHILIKRVIATSSQWVNIDADGNVYVDDKLLNEVYVEKKAYGEVDIEFPYQVPEETYFVLGDDRENSVDSRNSAIGTISFDEVIGKVVFRVWPLDRIGIIK